MSFQSTVADISNSFDLGLIDKREIARSLIDEIEEAARAAARGRFAKALEELSEFKKKVKHEAGRHVKGITPQVLLEDAEALIGQIPVTRRNDSERRGEMAEDEDRGQDRDQRGHGKAGDRDDRGDKRGPGRNGDEKQ